MYIAIEGIDFSGKSTLIEMLKEAILNNVNVGGKVFYFIAQPFAEHKPNIRELFESGKWGKLSTNLKDVLFTDNHAFINTIFERIGGKGKDKIIISDRSPLSHIVYNPDRTEIIERLLLAKKTIFPDITFVVRVSRDSLKKRLPEKLDDIENVSIDVMMERQLRYSIKESIAGSKLALHVFDEDAKTEDMVNVILDYIKSE